jgi:hypothetical protein
LGAVLVVESAASAEALAAGPVPGEAAVQAPVQVREVAAALDLDLVERVRAAEVVPARVRGLEV